jgi:hypothetical protein
MEGILAVTTANSTPQSENLRGVGFWATSLHILRLRLRPKNPTAHFWSGFMIRATCVAGMNARPARQRVVPTLRRSARQALPLGKSRRSAYADTARRGWAFPLTPLPSSPRQRKALARLDFFDLYIDATMHSKQNETNPARLPIHRRVADPPAMQLTPRDRQVVQTVYEYRFLRREQIETLLFPSRNTANRRLKHLFQHGFLKRLLPPVRLGEGRPQPIYALDERGADLIAAQGDVSREEIRWRKKDNRTSYLFLDHTLNNNTFRIAVTLAAKKQGYRILRWLDERDIKTLGERVPAPGKQVRYLPVTPDAFFEIDLGDRQAGFFLEMDMGTMANRRFKDKVRAYILYKTGGHYEKRFGTGSLRVLTVTTSHRRLRNLKRTTEGAGGRSLFWFTTLQMLSPEQILRPVWQISGQERAVKLFEDK